MKVVLLAHTPDPERLVAAAARLCYAEALPEEVLAGMTPEEIRSFLARLVAMDHLSPFEHASFTFAVSGVSRALTHELVRHRIASYSQRSQRYVNEEGFSFVTPPSIAADPAAGRIFAETMATLRHAYAELLSLGIPREDARFVLPNACTTQIVVTMNARSLRNFFALRCCGRAQWEIRELAWRMLEIVRQVAPGLFVDAGPPCEATGRCNQGKMSCGRLARKKGEGNRRCDG